MFPFVMNYDLQSRHPGAHAAFLQQAQARGLSSWTDCGGEMLQLPNTTVTGHFPNMAAAEAAFDAALAAARAEIWSPIILTKRFTIQQAGPGNVISNNRRPKLSLADLFRKYPPALSALARLGQVRA